VKIIIIDLKTEKFIDSLDDEEQVKVDRLKDLLMRFGHELRMPYSKKICSDLFELRGKGNIKIRILYAFRFDFALILHAFVKKNQKIPKQEINTALHKLKMFDTI
jgi:phage-related protein